MEEMAQIVIKLGIRKEMVNEDPRDAVEITYGGYDMPYLSLLGIRALLDQVESWFKDRSLSGRGWEGLDEMIINVRDSVSVIEQITDDWLWEGVEDVTMAA